MENIKEPNEAECYRPSVIKLLTLFCKAPTVIQFPVAVILVLTIPITPTRAIESILFRRRNAWTRGVARSAKENVQLDLEGLNGRP